MRKVIFAVAYVAMSLLVQTAGAVVYFSGSCGQNGGTNCTFTIENSGKDYVLIIKGTGNMENWKNIQQAPWFAYNQNNTIYWPDYITKVQVTGDVLTVGNYAFAYLPKVTEVTIEGAVNWIGDYAFSYMEELQILRLPPSTHLNHVGKEPVHGCKKLHTITGFNVIDNGWYTNDKTELIGYPAASYAYSYEVHDGCKKLQNCCFSYSQLYEVTLPSSITDMGWSAFYQISNLTDINANMTKMPYVNTYIVSLVDGSTRKLKDITVHVHNAALESYQNDADWNDMTIVADLDPDFEGKCGDNINYKYDPTETTLTLTGTGAMWTYNKSNPAPWTTWYKWSDKYDVDISKIIIGEGVTAISDGAFALIYHLDTVSLPSTLLSIGGGAFEYCNLSTVTLPDKLTSIGASAFYRNESLQELVFGKYNELIVGESAFESTALTDIYAPWREKADIPTLPTGVFGDLSGETKPILHVWPGTSSFYESKNVWKELVKIEDNYSDEDLVPLRVSLLRIDRNGNIVNGGIKEMPKISGDSDCEFNVSFIDENGNAAEDDFKLFDIDLLAACRDFGGIYFRGESTKAIITPSTTSEVYGFDHWDINFSYFESLENIKQTTLDRIKSNVSEDPQTHALTLNLEFGIIPNYVEYGEMPLFPYILSVYYKEGAAEGIHYVELNAVPTAGGEIQGAETGYFKDGTTLTINAYTYAGFEFTGWSDGVTTPERTITVNADTSLTANFEPEKYFTITVASADETMGTVSGGGILKKGSAAQIEATPKEGFRFIGWDDNGDGTIDSTEPKRDITVTAAASFTAYFELVTYTLTIQSANDEMGTVNAEVNGKYKEGASVNIIATAADHYRFINWSDNNTEASRTIVIGKSDVSLVAYFEAIPKYVISVLSAGNGTVSGGGEFEEGQQVVIKAEPEEGFEFVSWNDGNTEAERTITVTADAEYTASFRAKEQEKTYYAVTLVANPVEGGTLLGAGTYEEGTVTIIAANPNAGYEFIGWNDGVSEAARQLTVDRDIVLVANFHRIGDGVENIETKQQAYKIVRDGQVLIIRDGKTYNMLGAEVKQ